jgi:hypothetical protein
MSTKDILDGHFLNVNAPVAEKATVREKLGSRLGGSSVALLFPGNKLSKRDDDGLSQ